MAQSLRTYSKWSIWGVAAIAVGVGLWLLLSPGQARHSAKLECTRSQQTQVVTFFYKPSTSPARLHEIVTDTQSNVTDSYESLHGYSLSVPAKSASHIVATLLAQPEVISAKASPADSCLDPD